MKECANCCVIETQDSIRFDENGVCNVCNQNDYKRTAVDWDDRLDQLHRLCDRFRGTGRYDCIVPFSGGKDSTYTLWYIVKKLKMKPLVVSFDHGFYRPRHLSNRARTLKRLGVDFTIVRVGWNIVREVMLESLKRKGDFCWHCHCGCYVVPVQTAIAYDIPLIFWGQPNAEYGSYGYTYEDIEVVDERQFNRYINLGITAEDMVGMLPGWVKGRDLAPFSYPDIQTIRAHKLVSLRLGSFIPWDPKSMAADINQTLGWEYDTVEGIPPEYGYEKVECMFNGIRDYLKFIKRGFGRTRHLVSIDIRDKRIEKKRGVKLIEDYDGRRPASLDVFLELLGLTETEFNDIASRHSVAPYNHDFNKTSKSEPLWDQHLWPEMLGL